MGWHDCRTWDVSGDLGPLHELLEIDALHRLASPDRNLAPLWHLEGHNFDLRRLGLDEAEFVVVGVGGTAHPMMQKMVSSGAASTTKSALGG